MTNREKDIQRYLRGEMSAAEQHALEKAALSDPFLAEALEGLSNLTEAELAEDLETISAELETQTEHVWQIPAAGAKRKMASEAAASFAAELNVAPAPKPIVKSKRNWIWPLRIAALLLVFIGGYLFIPLLINDQKEDLALQQEITKSDSKPEAELIPDTTSTAATEIKEEKKPAVVSKPMVDEKAKAAKPAIAQAKKDTATDFHLTDTELSQAEKIVTVTEAPIIIQPQEQLKKEAAPVARSKSTLVAENFVIQGRVLAEEDSTPLPGVNIVIKGTTTGAVTDMNGHYQINSALPNPILQYSFIGLQSQEVAVKQPGELNVEMKSDVSQLSEVVITGYSPAGADPNREPVIKLAQPAGGLRAYDKYLKNSLRYPRQALENNVKGRVTVSFTVHTDGSVDEFNVLKGLGFGCDEEVIRLVKAGPKWSPTTQDGAPVESEIRVRVKFAPPSK
jgi:TonB family protein